VKPGGVYLDASAIVKLVFPEAESTALREFLQDQRRTTNRVALVEVPRAVAKVVGSGLPGQVDRVFERVVVLELTEEVVRRAARLPPVQLRSLDAIHLAQALELGGTLEGFVTYDNRLADAARLHGLPVESPA
jgi:predicted nucleic acid-binding protein